MSTTLLFSSNIRVILYLLISSSVRTSNITLGKNKIIFCFLYYLYYCSLSVITAFMATVLQLPSALILASIYSYANILYMYDVIVNAKIFSIKQHAPFDTWRIRVQTFTRHNAFFTSNSLSSQP